jgi:hypothetical protein
MNKLWLHIGALLGFASALCAQEPSKSTGASSAARTEYARLVKEYETAQKDYIKAYQSAKSDKDRAKLKYPEPQAYARRFLDLARKYPKDPVAVDALVWVASNVRRGKEFEEAVAVLSRQHLGSEKLEEVCRNLVYSDSPNAEATLRTIWQKSPHRAVQGRACYSLGLLLKDRRESAGEAEKLFEQVIARYGDVKARHGTLGDAAKAELFESRNLAIGKTAPEIEGEDVEGKKFKLSDYRGRVVVLDFWGDW